YLDHRIIEMMACIPSKGKIRVLDEKHILKKTYEGILPQEIISRPKQPYRAPVVESLLHEKTRAQMEVYLADRSLREARLFDVKKVRLLLKKLDNVSAASEVDSMALAGILSVQIMHQQFISGFSRRLPAPVEPDLFFDRRSGQQASQSGNCFAASGTSGVPGADSRKS
ncbi:MAG: hypothetical protein JRJ12_17195, partial [Deltaproteobacteria bacterium]|nr:hypothetical protein [Deltaproteobacteria bacterium]